MKLQLTLRSLHILFSLILCACSTPLPTQTLQVPDEPVKTKYSTFEINYSLGGHGGHRLAGEVDGHGNAHLTQYLEDQIVDKGQVSQEGYERFFTQLTSFTKKSQRTISQECRSPFYIILKTPDKTYTSKGCRTAEDLSFAKLVRDAEFLLYSKK